jgi:hypothetical protein
MAKDTDTAAPSEGSTKGKHRATYAKDNRTGKYLVRVTGPHSNKFVKRDVPVTRLDGSTSNETLTKVIWTGMNDDPEKGPVGPVTLYAFEARPADQIDEVEF